jgi:hypothetical protein
MSYVLREVAVECAMHEAEQDPFYVNRMRTLTEIEAVAEYG